MGERKARRERFFREHPYCSFCGGTRPASTEDHQPARVFFKGKMWPEGFVFPACHECNAVSRVSEKIAALLLHGEGASEDRSKFQRLVRSVQAEYPDLLGSMLPQSAREIRSIMREKGITLPSGVAYATLPLVKLDRTFWAPHLEMLSRKLLLAFHYACFQKPLSQQGGIWAYQFSNVDVAAGRLPTEILSLAPNIISPERQRIGLADQFSLRWASVPEKDTGLFFAQFHDRFAVSGVTTEYVDDFSEGSKPPLMRAFKWL